MGFLCVGSVRQNGRWNSRVNYYSACECGPEQDDNTRRATSIQLLLDFDGMGQRSVELGRRLLAGFHAESVFQEFAGLEALGSVVAFRLHSRFSGWADDHLDTA